MWHNEKMPNLEKRPYLESAARKRCLHGLHQIRNISVPVNILTIIQGVLSNSISIPVLHHLFPPALVSLCVFEAGLI